MSSPLSYFKFILLIGIFLFLPKIGGHTTPPNWSVNPSDFSLSNNMAVQLFANGSPFAGSGNIFGIFVNGEVRGVANETPGLPSYFFLNAYSNTGSDVLTFKVYVADDDQIYDLSETIVFNDLVAGTIYPLTVLISSDQPISIKPFSPETQIQGYPFQTINLQDSLVQFDSDEVVWAYSGNSNLNVTIIDSILNVIPSNSNWTGTETITITATEQTPNAYSASQAITYTVIPNYGAPNLGTVDDQTIGLNQSFQDFDLNDVLAPYSGDNLIFDYFTPQTNGTASDQGWSINSGSFQYSLTTTVRVHYGNSLQHSNGSKLLAYIDGSLAGVVTPTLLGNEYLYFLNIYSNTNNKIISFKFFDPTFNQLYTIQHTEIFQSNGNIGTPGNPLLLNTAPLNASIDANGNVAVGIEEPGWTGQQVISFIAADGYQPEVNSGISSAVFEVLNENAPEISNIPNQYIAIGESFNTINLDNHLTELDGDAVSWSARGQSNLQMNYPDPRVRGIAAL